MEPNQRPPLPLTDNPNRPSIPTAIVEILAVQTYEIRQTDLIGCLNQLGFRDENNEPFTYKNIRPFLTDRIENRVIVSSEKGLSCGEELWFDTIKHLFIQGRYRQIAEQVLQAVPLVKPLEEAFYNFKNIKEFLRAFLMALFSNGEFADPDLIFQSGQQTKTKKFQQSVFTLFTQPFMPDLMDRIELPARWQLISHILNYAHQRILPVPEVMAYAISLSAEDPESHPVHRLLDHFLLTGRLDLHEQHLSRLRDHDSPDRFIHGAKQAMVCGNSRAAIVLFNEALIRLPKDAPGHPLFPEEHDNLFFLAALLGGDRIEDFNLGIRHIRNMETKAQGSPMAEVAGSMLPLFCEQAGMPDRPKTTANFSISIEEPLAAFFSILVMHWRNKDQARLYMEILKTLRDKAICSGYDWLSAEASSLLGRLNGQKQENRVQAKGLHGAMGTTSIVDLFEPVSQWKNVLGSIIRMGSGIVDNEGSPESENPERRLAWLLQYDEASERCSILPIVQKRNKKGAWTKGKIMSLKDLYESHLSLDWLCPHDRQVCAVIEKNPRQTNFTDYRTPEFRFDMNKALPALAGHPLIFTEKNFHTPVELTTGEPKIHLRRHHQKLVVSMEPRPGSLSASVALIKKNLFRYRVVQFTPDQINLSRLIGEKELIIPERELETVSQAIESASSFITVITDLEAGTGQDFAENKGDATIHVHLTPWQEGVRMETLVQPEEEQMALFRPGQGGRYLIFQCGGKKTRTIRDLEQETVNQEKIIQACPILENLEKGEDEWWTSDPEQTLELLLELKTCNEKMIMKWPRGKRFRIRSRMSLSNLSLTLEKDREWFKATGKLVVDETTSIDIARLMALLESSSSKFIPLDDGTFLAITKSLKDRIDELKAYSTPRGTDLLLSPLAAPALEELTAQVGELQTDTAWKTHCKKLKDVVQPKIPKDLNATLRDYQVAGFHWLGRLAHWGLGGCLADDMGLGKTLQSLAVILVHASKGPSLVVAPLSVMDNWKKECRDFTPTMNPLEFGGKNRQGLLDGLGPFDLVICSYGLLHTEAENLSAVPWQTIVLDEAQAIKNRKTKRFRAAMKLNAAFRLITTGTPVENRLDELWTLFHFLNPGLLSSYQRFKQMFVIPIEGQKDRAASLRLQKLIRPFLLRRRKTEVLKELPEKTEIILQVEMSEEEACLYEAHRLKSLQNIQQNNDSPGQKHFRILAELTRLRRLCCNPSLVLPDAGIASSKLKVFLDTVKELKGNHHKALVFSQFVGHLKILRKALSGEKISFQYLDGSTPAKERQKRINDFQNGLGDLFLISLKAGGTGLNLTAADYVIHMDPWWNPAVEDQASDRAHRIGQTRPVTVYRLIVKDSIEERIVDLHQEKRALAEDLLSGSETAGKLSTSELLKLMQG